MTQQQSGPTTNPLSVVCPACMGTGLVWNMPPHEGSPMLLIQLPVGSVHCNLCHGSGEGYIQQRAIPPGDEFVLLKHMEDNWVGARNLRHISANLGQQIDNLRAQKAQADKAINDWKIANDPARAGSSPAPPEGASSASAESVVSGLEADQAAHTA